MTASAYKVWRVDCVDCGNVVDYEDTHPDVCEHCGAEVVESDVAD